MNIEIYICIYIHIYTLTYIHIYAFWDIEALYNGRNFADDIFKRISFISEFNETIQWSILAIIQHQIRWWLGAKQATSHYLKKWSPRLLIHECGIRPQWIIVRRAGLLWSQEDFEWRWSVPLFKCLTVLEFSFILFDLCLLITFFNFIMNYVPIVPFGYLPIIKFEFCQLCSVLYEVIELFIF